MLVVIENTQGFFWHIGNPVVPVNYHGEVVVVIDPSKTNMAMLVATPKGEHLAHIEFSGNNRRSGPIDDNTVYCYEFREYVRQFLQFCRVYMVAVEEAVTVKGAKTNHYTNLTLTEIRANILGFFLENYGIKPIEVNNWSWKFGSLPEGFRGKYEKGSKKYFTQCFPNSPLSHYFEADMTDCCCILKYVIKQYCGGYAVYCSAQEENFTPYKYTLVRANFTLPDERKVLFNPSFTLEENMNYYANRLFGIFTMVLEMDDLTLDQIYEHACNGNFDYLENDKVKAVISRI